MNIAFDAKRLFFNHTGLGNYSRTLVRNIQKYFPENKYILFTPQVVETPETSYFLDEKKFKVLEYHGFASPLVRSLGISSVLRNMQVDIYHGLSHEIPFGLKSKGIKSCVTMHDLIFVKYPEYFPFLDRIFYNLKYKYAASKADRVISISTHTSKDLIEYWKVDPAVIDLVFQSCQDVFFEEPASSVVKNNFLYVGSLSERKGLLDLIEAYALLEDKYRVPVHLIGNGSAFIKKLKSVISKKDLSDYFVFYGRIDNHQLVPYYDSAKALIYPSHYEGFGIPLIEASLRKVPVMTADNSSLPEAAGPDTLYFQAGNPESLASCIRYFIENEEEAASNAEKSYIYALNKFNPQVAAHSLINIYQKMLK